MVDAPNASAVARNGGGSFPPISSSSSSSSLSSRKEWRVVSDQPIRNSVSEVQRGRELDDVDFCSIHIDDGLDHSMLQQKLHSVSKQREDLQRLEMELRVQVLVGSEIAGFQKAFDSQGQEHENSTKKLMEQLHDKEMKIHELEKKLDDKERELHAIRMDNEAHAWAKDDLLREQSKELQGYRRERDNSDAERLQNIKQIHDLQEHIQEKERQFMELQEQNRVAQEAIIYKEDQIRDAQNWITRALEMESLQSTANQSLQAELRERTEQYNHLWLGCQRQFGDIERLHLHIQRLQHEVADAREKNGGHADRSHLSSTNSSDASRVGHISNQLEFNDGNPSTLPDECLQYGNSEISVMKSSQVEHVHGVTHASSLYGMPTYPPSTLHSFLMHQHGLNHPSHVSQAHFISLHGMLSAQKLKNQQAPLDGENIPFPNQFGLKTDSNYNHEAPVNSQVVSENSMNSEVDPVEGQGHDFVDSSNDTASPVQNSEEISQDALSPEALVVGNEIKEKQIGLVNNHEVAKKTTAPERSNVSNHAVPSEARNYVEYKSEAAPNAAIGAGWPSSYVSTCQKINLNDNPLESYPMEERALLACIARSIGSGGRISIISTLPNRLGKMLAPLHWQDYKTKYGKLDDFLASHSELFLIEGDNIQLRVGALKIIAAMAAAAKIAATAACPPPQSSLFPSVAVTPMAQSQRSKMASSLVTSSNVGRSPFHRGFSNVKTLIKSNDIVEVNGVESVPGRSGLLAVDNLTNSNKIVSSQVGGACLVRSTPGKQCYRAISDEAAPPGSRR